MVMLMLMIMVVMGMIVIVVMILMCMPSLAGFPEGHRFGGLSTTAGVTHIALPLFPDDEPNLSKIQSTLRDRTLSSWPCKTSSRPSPQAEQTAMK